ncbi:DUF5020 domain-containing protein [Bdellovibrio sp. HCB2-146]|uniref:DUF5020 domain-containing protein n=1 Tax=Bdellovibrio sp. HCB2-146 TaxID=3394362 RepID=UPI0039BCD4A6
MQKQIFAKFTLSLAFLLPFSSHAADWQQTEFQILHGDSYKAPGDTTYSKTVFTFNHVSSWAYGSNFFFFDISSPDTDDNTTYYGEFSPAFSLTKMGLMKEPDSVVKDILLQLNYELPQGPAKRAALAGVTIEWKDISIDYFATQFLYRDTLANDGHTGQFTIVWLKRFGGDSFPVEFSGFLDWAGQEGTIKDNLQTQPSLLYDFSKKTAGKVPLKLGVEWLYWKNKYGIDGLDESLGQAKLVWIF